MSRKTKRKANPKLIKKFYDIDIPVTKRKYTKGGQRGKFYGFNFYIQKNEKITKKQREYFFIWAEEYVGEVIHKLRLTGDEVAVRIPSFLDDDLTDLELWNAWNEFYLEYGSLIPDFRGQIEREMLRGYKKYLAEMSDDEKCKPEIEIEPEFEILTANEEEKLEELEKSVRAKFQQYHRKKVNNNLSV